MLKFNSENKIDTETRYTVFEVTRLIKITLEDTFYLVWVQGEISDFKHHSSGHYYFTLKDEQAQLSAVMWRGKNMSLYFTPQDGMKVLAKGRITVFEKSGRYQLDVDILQPLGVGELQIAFEQMKQRLQQEGLFDEKWKKPIPIYPDRVGIVTSPTGAAIRDIKSVVNRRFPGVQLILHPVNVQGKGAADDIARAIDDFNEFGKVDVLIVGRGGGSLEDLWPFNEEIVARAIFRSEIPVISAVGHEIDFTIADFVADKRAPTPSAAAELVVRDAAQDWDKINQQMRRLYRMTTDRLQYLHEKVLNLENSRALQLPLERVKQFALQLDLLTGKLAVAYKIHIGSRFDNVNQLENLLKSYDPGAVLRRGYSITYRADDKTVVKDSAQLRTGESVTLKFSKGGADASIEHIN